MNATHKGDHVYFQSADGARVGEVKALGKHGLTVASDGAHHRVYWMHVLGHKKRLEHAVTIVDQGEDGALVEDADGRRRYLDGDLSAGSEIIAPHANAQAGEPVPGEDETMTKTLFAESAQVLFLKGAPIKNRAGLALREVTDKAGHTVHKWMRAGEDAKAGNQPARANAEHEARGAARGYGTHDIEAGDTIEFKTARGQGAGEVLAAGKDGATIEDQHGNRHQILWKFVSGLKGGESASGDRGNGGGGADSGKPPGAGTGGGANDGDGNGKKHLLEQVKRIVAESRRVLGSQKPVAADAFSAAAYYRENNDAQASPDAIIDMFPRQVAEKIKAAQERLKSIEQTIDVYKGDGGYTPERLQLHGEIRRKFLSPEAVKKATPEKGQKPTFTVLGGRGGSGKSWFDGQVFDPDKAIVLDADAIKGMLPEYEGWNAAQVHEESSELFDQLTDMAARQGLNLVHDATMKTQKKALMLVKRFKDAGYRTEAHYMHLPRQEAAKRAIGRFMGKSGRYVPVDVVLENTGNEGSFDAVKGLVDAWSFRDNNVAHGSEPVLICQSNERGKNARQDQNQDDFHKAHAGKTRLRGLPSGAKPLSARAGQATGARVPGRTESGRRQRQGPLNKALLICRRQILATFRLGKAHSDDSMQGASNAARQVDLFNDFHR